MTNKRMWIAGLLLAVSVAGCTTHPAHFKPEDDPYHRREGRVQFETSRVKWTLQVARVDAVRVGNGLLKVIVTFRNTARENIWAEIRTTFLDENGHILEKTNWEPVLMDARTVTEYTCTSLGNQAADYQIIVRKPAKSSTGRP